MGCKGEMVVIPNLLVAIVELSDKTCWNMVRDATGMCFVLYSSGIDKDLIKISHICPFGLWWSWVWCLWADQKYKLAVQFKSGFGLKWSKTIP